MPTPTLHAEPEREPVPGPQRRQTTHGGPGLALHLGSVLGLPTVGITNRPLLAEGAWPADARGATAPLRLGGELVGYWLRTRTGTKPVAVHAAWRTGPWDAVAVVLAATRRARTPQPLRPAQAARQAHSARR
jgi:deoxyribonuclease V